MLWAQGHGYIQTWEQDSLTYSYVIKLRDHLNHRHADELATVYVASLPGLQALLFGNEASFHAPVSFPDIFGCDTPIGGARWAHARARQVAG